MISNELAAKLAKLIPLLASDKDGEVVAAARAMGRALDAEKLDFHDLAGRISRPAPTHPGAYGYYYAAREKPPSKGLYTKDGFLRPWKQVLEEILERHRNIPARYGGKFLLQHQIELLEKILRGEAAPHPHETMLKRIDERLRVAMDAQAAEGKAA